MPMDSTFLALVSALVGVLVAILGAAPIAIKISSRLASIETSVNTVLAALETRRADIHQLRNQLTEHKLAIAHHDHRIAAIERSIPPPEPRIVSPG